MDFNRNAFIADARNQGYDDDSINAYLTKKGVKPIGKLEKFVTGKAIPATGGLLGALGGGALGALTVPGIGALPGLMTGAMAGTGGGEVVRNTLSDLLGYQTKTPGKQLGEAGGDVLAAGTLAEIPQALGAITSPLKTTQKIAMGVRNRAIGEKSLPTDLSRMEVMGKMKTSDQYLASKFAPQKEAESALSRLYEMAAPMQSSGVGGQMTVNRPQSVPIKTLYQKLPSIEQAGVAYNATGEPAATTVSQGTNIMSRAMRDYLSQNISPVARSMNKLYGNIEKIRPGAERLKKLTIPAALTIMALNKLFSGFKGASGGGQ